MLNKQQRNRFHLIALIPLIIIGVWLCSTGYRLFVDTYWNGTCSTEMGCSYSAYSKPIHNYASVSLGSRWGGNSYFNEKIDQPIVFIDTNKKDRLKFKDYMHADNDNPLVACQLNFFPNVTISTKTPAGEKEDKTYKNLFRYECENKVSDLFLFEDTVFHTQISGLFESNSKHRYEQWEMEKRISIAFFFVPFVLYFALVVALMAIAGIYRFIRFGTFKSATHKKS